MKIIVVVLLINGYSLSLALSQPKFSPCALWNTTGTNLLQGSSIKGRFTGLAVDGQNQIYATDQENQRILIEKRDGWSLWNGTVAAASIFVTGNGEIYADRWKWNQTGSKRVMEGNGSCTGLFVDLGNRLYCSSANEHRVWRIELDQPDEHEAISLVGTGCPGPTPNMLDHPHGIFVTDDFRLYVADTDNHRIQLFHSNRTSGITVAGFGATLQSILNRPTAVVLDADENLFIVERGNQRISRVMSDVFQCLLGCSDASVISYFNRPQMMAFDPEGNILLTSSAEDRIDRFQLIRNTCGKSTFLNFTSRWVTRV